MEQNVLIDDLKKRFDGAISSCEHNLNGIRTGRASPNFLDPVVVDDVYGDRMALNQIASLTLSDSQTINIQVWDAGLIKKVEKAIAEAGLGVNPRTNGQSILVTLPALTEERRKELAKVASKYGEDGKIAVRNVRRDGLEQLKKLEKDTKISKDQLHDISEKIQKITDEYIKKIENLVRTKEEAINSK